MAFLMSEMATISQPEKLQFLTLEEDWEWRSEPADVAEAPAVEMAMKVLRHDPQARMRLCIRKCDLLKQRGVPSYLALR